MEIKSHYVVRIYSCNIDLSRISLKSRIMDWNTVRDTPQTEKAKVKKSNVGEAFIKLIANMSV